MLKTLLGIASFMDQCYGTLFASQCPKTSLVNNALNIEHDKTYQQRKTENNFNVNMVFCRRMAPRKGKVQKQEEQVTLGPQVKEGENVFGVAHIFASFNDTFVHVTDISGK